MGNKVGANSDLSFLETERVRGTRLKKSTKRMTLGTMMLGAEMALTHVRLRCLWLRRGS